MAKKLIALLLVLTFAFSLAACGDSNPEDVSSAVQTGTEVTSEVEQLTDGKEEDKEDKKEEDKKEDKEEEEANNSKPNTSKVNSITSTTSRVSGGTQGSTGNTTGGSTNASGSANVQQIFKFNVKNGKSLADAYDFKGKTFTMAITNEPQYDTTSFKQCVASFEKEYNCKIDLKTVDFAGYNSHILKAQASGKPYDICYAHGSMFPDLAIGTELYQDLLPYLRTEDILDLNKIEAGGIDTAKSSYFMLNGKLYGTCNYNSAFPYVIYYNKLKFKEKNLREPRVLAENNKWTWNTIFSYSQYFNDPDNNKYFLSNSFGQRGIALAYGAPIVIYDTKKKQYVENISSEGYLKSLTLVYDLFHVKKIAEPRDSAHPANTTQTMLHGTSVMFTEESSKYTNIADEVSTSQAFGRKKENIGITTLPLGETNKTKAYPTGWLTAVCAGVHKDKEEAKEAALICIAWDKFRSSYSFASALGKNEMSKTDQEFVNGLLKGDICCEVGKFGLEDKNNTIYLTEGTVLPNIVVKKAKPASEVEAVKNQMTACIKATMGKVK